MDTEVPLMLIPLVFPALVVGGRAIVARRRAARDIRPRLDPETSAWLQDRQARTCPAHTEAEGRRLLWTTHLEQPPREAKRAVVAFEGCSPGRVEAYAAADANCGPVEMVAMVEMPPVLLKMWEPGFVPMRQDRCPAGWSLTVAPGDVDTTPDPVMLEVLRAITPTKYPVGYAADADATIRALVQRMWGSLRIHFTPHRVYVIAGNGTQRHDTVVLADAIAAVVAARRIPTINPWVDTARATAGSEALRNEVDWESVRALATGRTSGLQQPATLQRRQSSSVRPVISSTAPTVSA